MCQSITSEESAAVRIKLNMRVPVSVILYHHKRAHVPSAGRLIIYCVRAQWPEGQAILAKHPQVQYL